MKSLSKLSKQSLFVLLLSSLAFACEKEDSVDSSIPQPSMYSYSNDISKIISKWYYIGNGNYNYLDTVFTTEEISFDLHVDSTTNQLYAEFTNTDGWVVEEYPTNGVINYTNGFTHPNGSISWVHEYRLEIFDYDSLHYYHYQKITDMGDVEITIWEGVLYEQP
jgi:hypothetical protein